MLLNKAEEYLKDVLEHKRCIPYSRYDHSLGRCSAAIQFGLTKGRYPEKSIRIMLNLLKNAKANAEVKKLNIEKLVIKNVFVNVAAEGRRRTYRAHGSINAYCSSNCHIDIVCEELKERVKKEKKEGEKTTVMLGVPLLFENIYKNIMKNIDKQGKRKTVEKAIKISNAARKIGIDLTHVLFKDIHNAIGGNMRCFICGAAAVDPEVAEGFRNLGIGFIQGYGLTECAPIAALNRVKHFKDDAAGLPLPGVEIKIADVNNEGIGEIFIKGGNLMLGYYENPELTADAITDGWYHSGDLGYIDKDGFVHITGRKKDIIVTKNGKNIFPEELETYLSRSEFIDDSLVMGKERGGDTIIAAQIVPNYSEVEAKLGKDYTQEQLVELIKDEITKVNNMVQGYKHILSFSIRLRPFAKTTTHKIQRFKTENLSEEGNIQGK